MSEEEQQLDNLTKSSRKPNQLLLADIYAGTEPSDLFNRADALEANPNTVSAPLKANTSQGRLKIFLGAAAGVGKTYAMLEEAQRLRENGLDVVVGYVEFHGRKETERLLVGLGIITYLKIEYRSTILEEMDTATIIERRPQLVLVDELAHTNAPGLAHTKRYEDIEEILKAGIDVFTTVNVQHVESLNDRVFELTGTKVRETFPDRFLDLADEVVLIDLPPEDLRERIREGKIYRPEKIEQALQNFFTASNLMILREMALRETADAVESSAPHREFRALHEEETLPTANPFILICVALKPQDSRVIRQGWRFARRLNAPVEIINVSAADERKIDQEQALAPLRRLARTLQIPFRELKGDPVEQIVEEARSKRVSLIVLGESTRTTWKERIFGSFTDNILRKLDGVDVYIVGDPARRTL
jgi:two-component system sensor histidine kinase KdpD